MDALLTFGDQHAQESAEWYPINRNFTEKKKIAVQNMDETMNTYGRVGENLTDASDTLTLRTRYRYNYQPPTKEQKQHIFYRGKWFEITEVRPRELGGLGIFRSCEYFLKLIEVNYGPDFAKQN